ncbi:MAG: GNAT family N-acetyltransferase [Actinobacteria bacterium]|nr:GNAT family N-acetyltransferase [Actinomycetota bacterium]
MPGLRVVRLGPERLRMGPWRGDARVACLAPVADTPGPTPAMVEHCCDMLVRQGFGEVVTAALSIHEQRGFLLSGFDVREELHLLSRALDTLPRVPDAPLRRGRRRDRRPTLEIDAMAFPPFWRLDETGLVDAMAATPSARFRVAGHGPVLGYAVSGRAGARGYLQRLAVHPGAQGRGLGRALVLDGLRWMRRGGAVRAMVNTQLDNDRALQLYQSLGFQMEPTGLAVLVRRLPDRELTS